MTAKLHIVQDPLFAGFYSVSDAARLLGHDNNRRVRGWLSGYGETKGIIYKDFEDPDTVSFLDLIELHFVDFFRSLGVGLPTLRKISDRLRNEWETSHPFAVQGPKYITDRRNVFGDIATESKDKRVYNAATGQFEIWETLEGVIAKDIVFDPKTCVAKTWRPKPGYDNVIIDPRVAFGSPVVQDTVVPTSTLYSSWLAEQSFEAVADWFVLTKEQVKDAVEFELALAA